MEPYRYQVGAKSKFAIDASEKTTRIYLSQMDGAVLDRENERMLRKLKERCLSL